MKQTRTPPEDEYKIRCPKLGHQIHFSYCRIEDNGLPCFKTLDCWYQHFLVEAFLQDELTTEEWNSAFGKPPKPKMLSLLEIIEQAKQAKRNEDS